MLLCMRDAVRKKRPEKWRTNSWFLLHDNAPAHRSVFVNDFLANNNVTVLEHPPHSPALVPTDVYLFPQMKSALKGWVFGDTTDIIKNATVELKRLSKLLPGKVSNTFTVAGRSVQFQKGGLFRRICILNNCIFCIVLYFSELN